MIVLWLLDGCYKLGSNRHSAALTGLAAGTTPFGGRQDPKLIKLIVLDHFRNQCRLRLNVTFFNISYPNFNASSIYFIVFELYIDAENCINKAIDAMHKEFYTNCAAAAKTFDVPTRCLQQRWKERHCKSTRASTNKALTND